MAFEASYSKTLSWKRLLVGLIIVVALDSLGFYLNLAGILRVPGMSDAGSAIGMLVAFFLARGRVLTHLLLLLALSIVLCAFFHPFIFAVRANMVPEWLFGSDSRATKLPLFWWPNGLGLALWGGKAVLPGILGLATH